MTASVTADRLPARLIPLLYLGTAHVSLALACLLVACAPQAVAGFFYHSRMVAIVHLITLGWVTFSILGAIYIVGPVVLRMPFPAHRADYVAWTVAFIGVVGMVAHFWIQEFGGMAWSAATVTGGILYVATRMVCGLRRATVPAAIKLHIALACLNIGLAAAMGILIAFDKAYHFLPGFVLSNVFAHAHLAAVGWAAMMVVGVGYRLLPMTLPSKMPSGRSMFASAVLLETGALGLFVTLLLQSAWTALFGVSIVAGLGIFIAHVAWMVRSAVPKSAAAARIDFAVLHVAAAGASLVVAVAIGLTLLVVPTSARTLHAAAAYGGFGIVGFLAQMVVAMETRLIPLSAWYWAYSRSDFRVAPTPPLLMRDRTLQTIVFTCWTVAVPALATGLALESAFWVAAGAWSLFVAVGIGALDNTFVLFHVPRSVKSDTRTLFISAGDRGKSGRLLANEDACRRAPNEAGINERLEDDAAYGGLQSRQPLRIFGGELHAGHLEKHALQTANGVGDARGLDRAHGRKESNRHTDICPIVLRHGFVSEALLRQISMRCVQS